MLCNLHVSNYALIDSLEIEFQKGLNIITGETGAGKSILLGALSLILGQRADTNVLKDKSKSCIIEGVFDISEYNFQEFFSENDIDYQDKTIIRRQINESGKSRAFINEIPVNLNILKDFGSLIIDIHSQHENLLLSNSQFQLNVIDSFASLQGSLAKYQELYKQYKKAKIDLDKLTEESYQSRKDLDYFKFQLDELINANLKIAELTDLEKRQQELTHASEIKESLVKSNEIINSDTTSIISSLRDVESALKKIVVFYPVASEIQSRMESVRIELKDIALDISNRNDKVEVDPALLEETTNRLNLLYTLLQKHRVNSIDELITLRDELDAKVSFISNLDFNLEKKQKELKQIRERLQILGTDLSSKRKGSTSSLEKSITILLNQLGIKYAEFKVDVQQYDDFQLNGLDKITFLFSANKQMPLQELSKVASGGELSRLMLSLKSLMIKSSGLPTIIFDEIDSGVSGEIADKMGNIISKMSEDMQVVNITHLPQIASKGKNHFLVYKETQKAGSETKIKLLSKEERIIEVAKMLSGEKVTEAALSNARELLSANKN